MTSKDIVESLMENNLNKMKESAKNSLSQKAAERLEEMKVDMASKFFGEKR